MTEKNTSKKADAVVKATAEAPKKTAAKAPTYYVTEDFYDNRGKRLYRAGEVYEETSEARTKALLEAKKSDLNIVGRAFLSETKPEGK